MPWCASCDRFLSPNTVLADGTCPVCQARVPDAAPIPDTATAAAPHGFGPAPERAAPEPDAADESTPIPWHLWLLVAAVVIYLGYRAFQGLELLFGL